MMDVRQARLASIARTLQQTCENVGLGGQDTRHVPNLQIDHTDRRAHTACAIHAG